MNTDTAAAAPLGTAALADLATGLWVAAFVVAVLAAHVAASYVRFGARARGWPAKTLHWAVASATMGTGIWSALLLGMGSEPVAYVFGFRALGLLAAWLAATAAAAAAFGLLMRWRSAAAVAAAGLLIPVGAVACGLLLVRAAGFVPGALWREDALALAAPLGATGCVGGLWLAFRAGVTASRAPHRRWWRWGAAATMAFSLIAAQELLISAAGMAVQTASVYAQHVPAAVACMVAAAGVPTLLLGLLFEQRLRRLGRPSDSLVPARGKRRRVRRMRIRIRMRMPRS